MSIIGLLSLPNEILALINHRSELPAQAALSQTCRALFEFVKSNNAALKDLKYLRQNYISFGSSAMEEDKSNYQIPAKLYEAVKKQDLALEAQINGEDETIVKEKESEAKKAALETGVSEDGPVVQMFLKRRLMQTKEKASGVWNKLTKKLQKQVMPSGRDIFSKTTYENNIEQKKLLTICKCINLHNIAISLKDAYKTIFNRDLKILDVKNDPSVLKDQDTFLQKSKELYNQTAVYLIFNGVTRLFPEAREYFMSIKDKSDAEIISLFEKWVESNTTNIVKRIDSLKNPNIIDILTFFARELPNRALFDIWKNHFFEPIFNVIPKESLFKYLTEVDVNENTPIVYASRKKSNGKQNRMFQNGNSKFVKYLLKSVEPDKRAECLLVKVNASQTVFQKILQNTEDVNLIKTILETVFPNPIELRQFVKENINSFTFASEKPSELKSWIGSKLIEEDLSNLNFGTLYSILEFNLRYGNIKNVAKALKSIENADLRKELIFRLFKNNSIDEDSKEFLYIFEIIYLLPDDTSQVEFIKLIDYKILKINYSSNKYDTEFLEVSIEELYEYFCENLKTEVAVGNYDPFINGFMVGIRYENVIDCFDLIPEAQLKELIIENFDFEVTANWHVINALFSQLNKDEKLEALKNHILSKPSGNDVNFYKFLDSHDILFEALTYLTIKFNPHKNCSLIQFLIHDRYFITDKKVECLSYVFEALTIRTQSEILDLLMNAVESTKTTVRYAELLQRYSEAIIKEQLNRYFPGIFDRITEYVDKLLALLDKGIKEATEYLVKEDQKHYHRLVNDFPNFKSHLDNVFPNITKDIEDAIKKAKIEANETNHKEDPRARKKPRVEKERGSKRKRK
ncbi:MAG: hypothetical protein KR126chlam6_00144 [Candidatus Anoxychlamydiales bacterium]|nr:hypothetical protein [Candidatus Anoxychlamydiales bacterium]